MRIVMRWPSRISSVWYGLANVKGSPLVFKTMVVVRPKTKSWTTQLNDNLRLL